MSIVVQAWTLVLRTDALQLRYPGGVDAFQAEVRNRCSRDEHLVGVSFMAYPDLKDFGLKVLDASRLVGFVDGAWQDLAPADQVDGPNARCDWLEFAQHPDGYAFCWLAGKEPGGLATREGWTPDESRTLRSILRSEVVEKLEPILLLHSTPQRAAEMAGVEAAIMKETGQVVYGRGLSLEGPPQGEPPGPPFQRREASNYESSERPTHSARQPNMQGRLREQMKQALGVMCYVAGVPLIVLGLLVALPYAFRGDLFQGGALNPLAGLDWGEVVASALFFTGAAACWAGRSLLRRGK